MIEGGEGLRFTLEARQPHGVVDDRVGQPLDRDLAIERRVARPVDFAHAAFADQRQHDVSAEARACGEGHAARLLS